MAVSIYNPPSTKIIHWTGVDFVSRPSAFPPVHLVQYDQKLPIIAVDLYKNGESYSISSEANANVLVEKKDGTFVSNPVLGCSSDRNVIYFEATYQMLYYFGTIKAVIELSISSTEIASSSAIMIIVDRNPVQENSKESSNEYKSAEIFMNQALDAKNKAASSASKAAISEKNTKDYLETFMSIPYILAPTSILDSGGEIITDSNGMEVSGLYQFSTDTELQDLKYKILVLTDRNHALEQRIENLTKRAILDSY